MNSWSGDLSKYVLEAESLVEILELRAQHLGDQKAYTFLTERGTQSLTCTYRELALRARIIGGYLSSQGQPGDRVILFYPPGLEYISAFLGCLYARMVAVPLYPPRPNQKQYRAAAVILDCGAEHALTSQHILPAVSSFLEKEKRFAHIQLNATEALTSAHEKVYRPGSLKSYELAFLQYTSGSTGRPKGVMISHRNLMANQEAIGAAIVGPRRRGDLFLNWLPLYHDMGLIGTVLHALYRGIHSVLMPSLDFIQDPVCWLEAITRYRATVCGGPNFAYELCLRKVTAERLEKLDLSSWRVALNGAEPVRWDTLKRFSELFADAGFKPETFYPCYGLAEATLLVTGGDHDGPPQLMDLDAGELNRNRAIVTDRDDDEAVRMVGSGAACADHQVVIAHPESRIRLKEGEVGEVWVSGPSVARGYWNQPERSMDMFQARLAETLEGPFLRTGDLGFLHQNELYVTGRLKELIIIRGRNHYAQDIEWTVAGAHKALKPDSGAAFAIKEEGEEQLVVAQEINRDWLRKLDAKAVVDSIRMEVSERHEVQIHAVVLLKPGRIPKTSSGKIQRNMCRDLFLNGRLEAVEADVLGIAGDTTGMEHLDRSQLAELPPQRRKPFLAAYLRRYLSVALRVDVATLDPTRPLSTMGLDSMVAMDMQHHIEAELDVTLPLTYFLEGAGLEDLAGELDLALSQTRPPTDDDDDTEQSAEFPLSYNQRALWFLNKLAPESPAYNVSFAVRIRSELEVPLLRGDFQALLARHASLRTVYLMKDNRPYQRVLGDLNLHFDFHNATGWHKEKVDGFLVRASHRPFNLETGPLLRIDLLKLASREYVLLLTAHHIAIDFWSIITLMEELGRLYGNESVTLPTLDRNYGDYVRKQEKLLKSQTGERLWAWWRDHLADEPPLQLPTDRQRPSIQTYGGDTFNFRLPMSRLEGLRDLARSENTTLYTVMLAVYQVLLHRYSGQKRIPVGSPTAGRMPGFENVVGYFVNPVVIRGDFESQFTFRDFLKLMRRKVLDALDHRDFPFQLLVERLQPERDPSRSPLFQVMFVLQKPHRLHASGAFALNDEGARMRLGGLDLEAFKLDQHIAQFDLMLSCIETPTGLNASLEYNTDLFEVGAIARMAEHFQTLTEELTADPDTAVAAVRLLPEREMRLLLVTWNGGGLEDFSSHTLHHRFEEQAVRLPGYTAVQYILPETGGLSQTTHHVGLTRCTYGEMNAASNQIAAFLQARGVGPGVPVGLAMERSVELLIAIMGILKAGGFYVPLDPSYPDERLAFMVEDSGVNLILSSRPGAISWAEEADWFEVGALLKNRSGDAPRRWPDSDQPAYMIYTSGSTGRPKGVLVPHRTVSYLMDSVNSMLPVSQNDTFVMSHSYAFDVSVWEIFACLLHGGRLMIPSHETIRFPEEMTQALIRYDVTIINQTPSAFRMIRDHIVKALAELKLRAIVFAGEDLEVSLLEPFETERGERVGPEFYNLYGITETTVYNTFRHVRPPMTAAQSRIGVSLPGEKIFVLDGALQVCPIGVPGEIHIWGDGLAFGYHQRPDLTAERFIPCPPELLPMVSEEQKSGARLYCTGDRGRYLLEGELAYMGRIDHQVKIRGFRIELGEIEHKLAACPEVQRCLVLVHDPHAGYPILVAYVQPKAKYWEKLERHEQTLINSYRDHMKGLLPEYMTPSRYVLVRAFSMTPNGKVNRKELPTPEEAAVMKENRDETRTPTEELVESIWTEVLEVDSVGLHANFFKIGGHSLLATQVMSRITETFSVTLPIRDMFEAPTVAGLSERLNAALRGSQQEGSEVIRPTRRTDNMPLSFAQQRLWLLDRLEGENAAYNMPAILRLEGALHKDALNRAVTEIVRRHEVLRASFFDLDGQPVQVFKEPEPFVIRHVDLTDRPTGIRNEVLDRIIRKEVGQPFDLSSGPLLRVMLVRTRPTRHRLLLTMHHIVSDGWSIGVMIRELAVLYAAYQQDKPSPLPEPTLQYADFAHWQRHWLSGEVLEDQVAYWREQLKGGSELIELPTDHPRPKVQTFQGAVISGLAPAQSASQLHEICHRSGATMFMSLLAAWVILLYRYSGQTDISVGSPIANRNRKEIEPLIGFFVNTLVFRVDLEQAAPPAQLTFENLLLHIRQIALGAYSHQDISFEQVVNAVQPERDQSHSPLFQVMFALQNVAFEALDLPGLTLAAEEAPHVTAKFDLNLSLQETEQGIVLSLEYNTDLFQPITIKRMLAVYIHLLTTVAEQRGVSIQQLPLWSQAEKLAFLAELNHTGRCEDAAHIQHQIIARAEKSPDLDAASSVDINGILESITYGRIMESAGGTEILLRSLGVKRGDIVAVYLNPQPKLPAAVLGIWSLGGVYLPLDPNYPKERLAYMLADSGAEVLLTTTDLQTELPKFNGRIVCLQEAAPSSQVSTPRLNPEAPAYMIYTSGSGGRPNATVIHHAALANVISAMSAALDLKPGDVQLAAAGISFDSSILELFMPLACGARLLSAPPGSNNNADALITMMTQFEVTVFQAPASTWRILVEAGIPESLKLKGVSGGEVMPSHLAADLLSQGLRLWNAYGPTETAIYCTLHEVTEVDPRDSRAGVPAIIGKPLANNAVYLLDSLLHPVLSGIRGEVCISGRHLAQGYHGRPDLTAVRFVPNPFSETPGDRLFRSGDLARLDTQQRYRFWRRIDNRLKLRGYRIEPGEIETVMNQCPGVSGAYVMLREDRPGDQHLVGYFNFQGEEAERTAITQALTELLHKRLPHYMTLTALIGMNQYPMNAAGEVDTGLLPSSVEALLDQNFTAPRQWIETELSEIWAEVLGLEQVGIHNDFFDLGGHSLLATRALSRIRDAFSVELPLRSFFESPTVAAMSERIQEGRYRRRYHALPPIKRISREQPLPLSFSQQRMWFLVGFDEAPNPAYCMASAMILRGTLNSDALSAALTEMTARHESLRTTFFEKDGNVFQRFGSVEQVEIPITPLQVTEDEQAAVIQKLIDAELQEPFDFETGPLLRIQLFELRQGEHLLLFNMHHIISDGWSIGVFISEFSTLYSHHLNDGKEPAPLKPLSIQYADFADWQRRWLSGEVRENQLSYWKQQLAGKAPLLDLPTDRQRPKIQSFKGGQVRFFIGKTMRDQLMHLAQTSGSTLFMCLYGAWSILLARYSGMTDIWVGTPVANRNREEVESLIGLFVNTLVLRLDLAQEPDAEEALTFPLILARVRHIVLNALARQDIPFEQLVDAMLPDRDMSHHPLFQVVFVLQNTPRTPLSMPGLEIEEVDTGGRTSKFDLTLAMVETEDGLTAELEYNSDLFLADTIRRMAARYQILLESILEQPKRALTDLTMVRPEEKYELLAAFNDNTHPETLNHSLIHIFEEQVVGTGSAPAVFEAAAGEQFSYRELADRVDQISYRLQSEGIGPGDLVGVHMERCLLLPAALLAVLKVGAAYVPLDPKQPADRLHLICSDAAMPVILTDSANLKTAPDTGSNLVLVDETPTQTPCLKDLPAPSPGHTAYVVYTSGATGRPKGVVITRQSLANLLFSMSMEPGITKEDVLFSTASMASDNFGLELFLPLLAGALLVLGEEDAVTEDGGLAQMLLTHKVSMLQTTPKGWRQLAAEGIPTDRPLKGLSGGEPLPADLAAQILDAGVDLYNVYGPTETTIWSTLQQITPADLDITGGLGLCSMGRPITNTTVHILDKSLHQVPLGLRGRLHIGGTGLATGYHGKPDLTALSFIPNPFSNQPGSRLYRSGDLARIGFDMRLEFCGRVEFHIKVCGSPVIPHEAETDLLTHPDFRVVVLSETAPDGPIPIGYYESNSGEPLEELLLKTFLSERLPTDMIPETLIHLDHLPMTVGGELDHDALPRPDFNPILYSEPRDWIEEELCSHWSKLLMQDRLSIHQNFFEAGGHSLLVAQVLAHIKARFGVSFSFRTLFENPDVAGLAEHIRKLLEGGEAKREAPIHRVNRTGDHPLSPAQMRMWFLIRFDAEAGAAYHIPLVLKMKGALNLDALSRAFTTVIEHHTILRTTLHYVDGAPVQRIIPSTSFEIPHLDLSDALESSRDRQVQETIQALTAQPFDLTNQLMIRAYALELAEHQFVLLVVVHHIAADGWSLGVFAEALGKLYQQYLESHEAPPVLEQPRIQYVDYAHWCADREAERSEGSLDFWRETLADYPTNLVLPYDRKRPTRQTFEGRCTPIHLEPRLVRALNQFSQEWRTTLFMTLQGLFSIFLSIYSGMDRLLIGATVANRGHREVEALIGLFVNTVVLRANLRHEDPTPPDLAWLMNQTRTNVLNALSHQDTPFERVVEVVRPDRQLSHNPLVQVMFSLQTLQTPEFRMPGLEVEIMTTQTRTTKFDLTLFLGEADNGLSGVFEYNTDLFDHATVQRMTEHFKNLVEAVVQEPNLPLTHYSLLDHREMHQLLVAWNGNPQTPPTTAPAHRLIESIAAADPDCIAATLVTDPSIDHPTHLRKGQLTYAELNAHANQLAHLLMELGSGPEVPVMVFLDRGFEMLISLLAVLKTGACYLPMDVAGPKQRLAWIAADAAAPITLTSSDLTNRLPEKAGRIVAVDRDIPQQAPTTNPNLDFPTQHPAYIMYTFGSTDRPKGVAVSGENLNQLLGHIHRHFDINDSDVCALFHSSAFNLSVWEIWGTLCRGGRLVVIPFDLTRSPRRFLKILCDQAVTVMMQTPTALSQLIPEAVKPSQPPLSLRLAAICGEALDPKILRPWFDCFGEEQITLVNLYGMTETTVYSTVRIMSMSDLERNASPIGTSLDGLRMFVLDPHLRPLPIGIPGELYLGGWALARGYFGSPDLTATRFVPCPESLLPDLNHQQRLGRRLYRTGDLARYLPDGDIIFIGRLDHQVKIRGFRVELGEIEAVLREHPAVTIAKVLLREAAGGARLSAWVQVVDAHSKELKQEDLIDHLHHFLPEYMVPQDLIILAVMPMTANGKADVNALPLPRNTAQTEIPTTPLEQEIAAIWSDLLEVNQFGRHDSFFDLGGQSLMVILLAARLQAKYAVDPPFRFFFEHSTIAEQAQWIESHANTTPTSAQPSIIPISKGNLSLSLTQERTLTLLRQQPDFANAFNMVAASRIRGPLHTTALIQSLREVIERHQVLRTAILDEQDSVSLLLRPVAFELPLENLQETSQNVDDIIEQRILDEATRPVNLTDGIMMRGRLLRLNPDHHVLVLTIHHIACDGWSLNVLQEEIGLLYSHYLDPSNAYPLDPLPFQFADYAAWQRDWLDSQIAETQLNWWRQQLADAPPLLDLPLDRPRSSSSGWNGALQRTVLRAPLKQAVQDHARRLNMTSYMWLEAVFAVLMARLSGQSDLCVGSLVATRTPATTESLMGYFVNWVTLRHDMRPEADGIVTFDDFASRTARVITDALEHSNIIFEQVAEALVETPAAHPPLFQVKFNQMPSIRPQQMADLELTHIATPIVSADAELYVDVVNQNDHFLVTWTYRTDLFDHDTIRRMAARYIALLETVIEHPQIPLGALLEPDEQEQAALLRYQKPHHSEPGAPPHEPKHNLIAIADVSNTGDSWLEAQISKDAPFESQTAMTGKSKTDGRPGIAKQDPTQVTAPLEVPSSLPAAHARAIPIATASTTGLFLAADSIKDQFQQWSEVETSDPARLSRPTKTSAAQIAAQLGLQGPCLDLHATGTAPLIAACLAKDSLLMGHCEAAIIGGPQPSVQTKTTGDLVLLKRLTDIPDQTVSALIRSSAWSRAETIQAGITRVVTDALNSAALRTQDLDHIECMGGQYADLEADTLSQLFDPTQPQLGSISSQTGLTGSASVMASLIRAIATLKQSPHQDHKPVRVGINAFDPDGNHLFLILESPPVRST